MGHPAFQRMAGRVNALLGLDSILRGEVVTPPRKIVVKHDVQFEGYGHGSVESNGDIVVPKSVAYVLNEYNPQVGDLLQHPDGNYELDVQVGNNGYQTTFVLRKYTP